MLLRRLTLIACLAAGAAAADSAADSTGNSAADEAAIRQRLLDWITAFNARDADAACDLFAPDLSYAVPGIIDGTQATMCGNLARTLARDDLRLRYAAPEIHRVLVSGDLAAVRLTWTLTTEAKGETATATEEGMDIFRRQPDGRWSIAGFVAFAPQPEAR